MEGVRRVDTEGLHFLDDSGYFRDFHLETSSEAVIQVMTNVQAPL